MHMREVTIAYGMTETSPVSFQSATDDPLERRVIDRRPDAAACRGQDRRSATGRIVPRGAAGELCTRGYSVMLGYWDDEESTREAIDAAGWMHTGDLATIDDEGYCNIVGRIKDMVIRGGENIYPREIEEFLYRHPEVQDVQVIGVPDRKYGEELCAWISLRDRERRRTRTRSATSAEARSPTTRCRATSDSSTVSDDGNRQDPEVPDARADERRTRPHPAADCLRAPGRSICSPLDAGWRARKSQE